jgi:biotin carboxylase
MSKTAVLLVNTGKKAPIHRLYGDPTLRVTTITESWYAPLYPAGADLRVVANVSDLRQSLQAALEVQRESGIEWIVAPTERSLPVGGYLRSVLGVPGMSFETSNLFSNKLAMKHALSAAGVRIAPFAAPRSWQLIPQAAEEVGYPVVVKPAIGTGSKDTYVCRSRHDLEDLLHDERGVRLSRLSSRLLVERFIEMDAEYHAIVESGQTRFMSLSRYFAPLLRCVGDFNGCYVLPTSDPRRRRIELLHQEVVSALGLVDGVTHLELFETAGQLLVGEITCRPAGGGIPRGVMLAEGVDLWDAFVALSLGRSGDWVGQPVTRIVANCSLPIKVGAIRRLSSTSELLNLPGAIEVDMTLSAGDVVSARLNSSSTTGTVFFAVDREELVADRLRTLSDIFELEMEPAATCVPCLP